ncbi:MAG: glycerol-3-phosphate 1-O-acyltransferase PlsY [Gammaproteobacteria bacterium]|nr:glycerol-3-phosphate 1-O-acyltransferase PlsY [Gammaproteobacteria bacterium]MCP5136426.1 glycerol-3-phosphate 1-O-acyltransferase PlsY [Gammaproteobacteria bacterium]
MTFYLLLAAAYLLGSISSAIIVCRLMGLPDPRTVGSNNPGATNVLRVGGKKAAAVTLFGDMLKGFIPALVGFLLGLDPLDLSLVGFAAFIGHLYPLFFGFKGGKGVATALGAFFGMHWLLGAAVAGTWLLFAKVFRISSVAALIATALAAPFAWWLIGYPAPAVAVIAMMVVMLWWRHRSNIRKLIHGSEDSIGTDAQ